MSLTMLSARPFSRQALEHEAENALIVLAVAFHVALLSATVELTFARAADAAAPRALAVAESLWIEGKTDDCRQWLTSQIDLARAERDRTMLGELLALRGQVNARVGPPREAEADLREAIDLADGDLQEDQADRGRVVRRSLRWLGFALLRLGRDDEVLPVWQRLVALSQEALDREYEAWGWAGIAFESWRAGQADRSLAEYQLADSLFCAEGNDRGRAFLLNGIGTALQSAGLYDEAVSSYEGAIIRARDLDWQWLEAIALNNIAAAHFIVGDPGRARAAFLEACDLHIAAGDAAEAALSGANVARCDAALGHYEDAAWRLETIWKDVRLQGIAQLDGSLSNALAGVRREQGRDHAAARLFRESSAAGVGAQAKARLEGLIGLARTLADMDSAEAALIVLERDRAYVDSLQDPRLQTEFRIELGTRLLASGRMEDALSLLSECAAVSEARSWRSLQVPALAAAARAARSLHKPELSRRFLESARRVWEDERGMPADPEWRERRTHIGNDVRQQLGALLAEYPESDPEEIRVRTAFDAVQHFKARTILERMIGPTMIDAPNRFMTPVTCAQLQNEILQPGELLVDFYIGEEESFLLAVTRDECRYVSLSPGRALADPLRRYTRMISGQQASDPRSRGADLLEMARKQMISAILPSIDDMIVTSRTLILVPDGILHQVSFASILAGSACAGTGDGTGGNVRPSVPVLQIVPSATILAQLRQPAEESADTSGIPGTILALAGACDSLGRTLHGAQREVRELRRRFHNVTTSMGSASRATRGAASNDQYPAIDMAGHAILHFASHAVVHEEWPWRSAVHLDCEAGAMSSPRLTADEIARTRFDARLVVLSSCRTAGGQLVSGEGMLSLAGAFLVAGVPVVVATLWPVDDRAAPHLMRRFYDGLAAGLPVSDALAHAQAGLRRHRRWSEPIHWAAYVALGDGSRGISVERRSYLARNAWPIVLILLGILALGGSTILRGNRSRV